MSFDTSLKPALVANSDLNSVDTDPPNEIGKPLKRVKTIVIKSKLKNIKEKKGKVYRVESFLTNDRRVMLAGEITRIAHIYNEQFNKLAKICDADLRIHGVVAQVQIACLRLQRGRSTEGLLSEAIEAAKSRILLTKAKRTFEAEGIPCIMSLELTRRVFDAHLKGSKELVYRGKLYP